jgi:hypothetical protein
VPGTSNTSGDGAGRFGHRSRGQIDREGLFPHNAELEVPSPEAHGIAEIKYFDGIPVMAAQALASGSPQNNPRVPAADQITDLYKEVWA